MVRIKCDAKPGPFDEQAITIDTGETMVSGFVKKTLVQKRGDQSLVVARVIAVKPDSVEVQIAGSFFTTALGVASLSRTWADNNLEA